MSGLNVDILCTGIQGLSPLILHLKGSDKLLSCFLISSESRFVPLHRLDENFSEA